MLSVVMPAYNASRFIGEAIESVLNQTLQNFELIIVDDGSEDNTRKIIESYAQKDSRIVFLQSDHKGASAARNLAVSYAQYDWIAIMDSDDISLPTRFEQQLSGIELNPDAVVWGAYVKHINSKGDIISLQEYGILNEDEFKQLRQTGCITFTIHPASILKKEAFLKAGGYNPHFPAAHDLDLIDRMAEYGPVLTIPEVLLLYRVHPYSISMQKFFVQAEVTKFVERRCQARARGRSSFLSFDTFKDNYQKELSIRKTVESIKTVSRFLYRRAGLQIAEGQYVSGGLNLAFSTLLNPFYSIPRVWKQRLSQ